MQKAASWLVLSGACIGVMFACSQLLEQDRPYVDHCKGLPLSHWEQRLEQCMRDNGYEYQIECAELLARQRACRAQGSMH